MSEPRVLSSVLATTITRYLSLKRALGRKYASEQAILTHLDAFLSTTGTDLTFDSFTQWSQTHEHLSAGVRRNWMRVVRNLALYRRRGEPACFVPNPSQFPAPHQPVRPHIFTGSQITRLLLAAAALRPGCFSPLRSETFRLALVLLYTTGMRRGELLRLTIGDYRADERTLLVRESKFHKSRLLPLSPDGARVIEEQLRCRRALRLPANADTALVWNSYGGGRPYSGECFHWTIRRLFLDNAVRTDTGGWPRVHDFRHTFAVHALQRWYREGADVQAKLPSLATYMGHVSIVSTQYYLRYLDPLGATPAELFARRCGGLVTPATPEERPS